MTTIASTIASSSTDGTVPRPRPDHSEEWIVDYQERLQAGINRRKPPEGELEHVERIVLIPE